MNAALTEGATPLEMATQRGGRAVKVVPNVFRVGGDRVAICRLEAPVTQMPAAPETGLARTLRTLFDQGVEAMIFADTSGVIRHANDRFLEMVDAAHLSEVKGRHVAEFLSRGQVDFGVMSENVARGGHLRLYATEMVSDYGSRTPVEVSAAMLQEGREQQIALVIRDAARVEAVRLPGGEAETASQQNILELVGSASLKEIVAETNDVIEKLCIETAIRLTNNNRVAAAEMLGLSRQSLYVKLRKYGLVKKTDEE
jgi:transcriptional regulator PpsR